MTGRLIAFEGGEGSGKSTQARLFAEAHGALLTHEPGGTGLGRAIRKLVLDPATGGIGARAEALLLAADRAQHVDDVIAPALAGGRDVVSDRYSASSLAYQGYGRGLPVEEIRSLTLWASGRLEPDVVVLLDVPLDVARTRWRGERDRLEAEAEEFHVRVAEGYDALARAEPDRWLRVDGVGSVDEVAGRVSAAFAAWSER